MKRILCSIWLAILAYSVDANRFRCDYKFFKDADMYMKYHEIPATWQDAWLRCNMEGTTLASPLNESIKSAMNSFLKGNCERGVWTGIHSIFSVGDYTTVEGIPLAKIPHKWLKCEPDNNDNKEGCIVQLIDGSIADGHCNETLPYFCYRKVEPGMSMNACGTNDNAYNLDKRTGKCYKFHRHPRIWSRAYMACMAEGGHLVVVNSQAEADIVRELFNKYGDEATKASKIETTDVTLIGFHEWNEKLEWRTIFGQTLEEAGYSRWDRNQPSAPSSIGRQSCGAMFKSGLLDNGWCHLPATFVCEKDPESLMCDHEQQKPLI